MALSDDTIQALTKAHSLLGAEHEEHQLYQALGVALTRQASRADVARMTSTLKELQRRVATESPTPDRFADWLRTASLSWDPF